MTWVNYRHDTVNTSHEQMAPKVPVGWYGFNGIFSTQVTATSCLSKLSLLVMNDIKVDTTDQYILYS